ncbi:hypothetical protein [Microbacterium halotolerans]|nr:hypothetical protein [Microbacterium halotolerans]
MGPLVSIPVDVAWAVAFLIALTCAVAAPVSQLRTHDLRDLALVRG